MSGISEIVKAEEADERKRSATRYKFWAGYFGAVALFLGIALIYPYVSGKGFYAEFTGNVIYGELPDFESDSDVVAVLAFFFVIVLFTGLSAFFYSKANGIRKKIKSEDEKVDLYRLSQEA